MNSTFSKLLAGSRRRRVGVVAILLAACGPSRAVAQPTPREVIIARLAEIEHPSSYEAALEAAERLRRCRDLNWGDLEVIAACAPTIDAEIAQVDPNILRVPPCPYSPRPPVPFWGFHRDLFIREDVWRAACARLASDPVCAGFAELIPGAAAWFTEPRARVRVLSLVDQSQKPEMREKFKEFPNEVKKIAKRIEKEKPIKKFLLKEIDKELDGSDPAVVALRLLVESLSEEELARILGSLLLAEEEAFLAMLETVLAAEAERERQRVETECMYWTESWIDSHRKTRKSVGLILEATLNYWLE